MNSPRSSFSWLLTFTVILVVLFNVIYWTGKFFPELIPPLTDLRKRLLDRWGLLMFLEFLIVVSLFVDLVIKWDDFSKAALRRRLLLTGLLVGGWVARFGLGVIDLYMIGEVQ